MAIDYRTVSHEQNIWVDFCNKKFFKRTKPFFVCKLLLQAFLFKTFIYISSFIVILLKLLNGSHLFILEVEMESGIKTLNDDMFLYMVHANGST